MGASGSLLLSNVRVDSRLVDVLVRGGVIAAIGHDLSADAPRIDGAGGALFPGLHDHHIHLLAAAAAASSIVCGGPDTRSLDDLAAQISRVPGSGWVRAINYDESVAGPLTRAALDAIAPTRPVRVQHRGGSLWYLNSNALDQLSLTITHPDGLLWRGDPLLRGKTESDLPDLAPIGARLASFGVTGVTDATPGDAVGLSKACKALQQRVITMGTDPTGRLAHGPTKIVVSDHSLPGIDDLVRAITRARDESRPVAIHSVTRESLLLVLAAFDEAGAGPGDRIEHASIAPPEAIEALVRHSLTIVTQPSLIHRRGSNYQKEVDVRDQGDLWQYRTFLDAGLRVVSSSDAPHGDLDPWASIRAARDRVTSEGTVLGPSERVGAEVAFWSYLYDPMAPGMRSRRVRVGAPADLVLVDAGELTMLDDPRSERVRMTLIGGGLAYERANESPAS